MKLIVRSGLTREFRLHIGSSVSEASSNAVHAAIWYNQGQACCS